VKALILGGLGFIGSNLCRHLLDVDPDVQLTVVDDQSGTIVDWTDLKDRCEVIVGDMRTFTAESRSFDEVWHLASPVGSLGILSRTGEISRDILDLAGHAHEIAAANEATLLYVSSSEVYGRDGQHSETVDLIVPNKHGARMEYSLGKLTAEHMLYNLARDSGVPLRIARPFNCAGPGQSERMGFVIPTFVRAALEGRGLPVHGDGKQRRAFCHVADLVEGLAAVHRTGEAGHLYNVGQPDGVLTISELARFVVARLGSTSPIAHIDPAALHGPHWTEAFDKVPDIDKIRTATGWSPKRDLGVIIDDVASAMLRVDQAA